MKSKGILDLIVFSEYRKTLLFLLQDNPMNLSEIKDFFGVTTPEIQPHLKKLEEAHIITKDNNNYILTPVGNLLANELNPALDTIQTLDNNLEFFGGHDLSGIPSDLLNRIRELKDCTTVLDSKGNIIYDSHDIFKSHVLSATRFIGFTSIFLPSWPATFLYLAQNNIQVELIVTDDVFEEIQKHYSEQLEEGLQYENAHLYVCEHANIAFGITDKFFSLSLYRENGIYDSLNDLIGFDHASIKWGEDLFEYYKGESVEIVSSQMNEYVTNENVRDGVMNSIDGVD